MGNKPKLQALCLSAILLSVAHAAQLDAANITAQNLFNGKDLKNWKQVGKGHFVIENGLLRTQGGMGLLWYTKKKFANAIIRIIYKTTYPDSNSGVFVHIGSPPKTAWDAVHNGYEIQICDAGPNAADDFHSTGSIYSFSQVTQHAEKGPHQWNTLEIALQKNKIIVHINGTKVNEFDPNGKIPPRTNPVDPKRGPRASYGYIGIQNHDHDAKQADNHVYFKEISVHPLS